MLRKHRWLTVIGCIAWFTISPYGVLRSDEYSPQQLEFFEKNIRPVLAEHCFKCHSADAKQRGGLMLDTREAMLKGGDNGPAIVVDHPEKSRLIKALEYGDPDLRMPPNGKLKKQQIELVTQWIKNGAAWPKTDNVAKKINEKGIDLAKRAKHWSFQPMKRPAIPKVENKDWPKSPIDYFILAKLEEAGLQPNPKADKRPLLRRVTFDLIGLPPTKAEIDAFLKDDSPKAFEKVVERLLDSPHYGERWGRHWLDLVRYAETAGHEFDFEIPEAWRYRDYVIRAFNADVPYDQFVIEHIAGDLATKPRLHPKEKFNESILGTGFWFLGESKHSPVDIRGDQADRLDNQIDVFGKAFLGLTLACAKCHDHKFDPITTRDYYSIAGYLQSSRYQRAFFENPEPFEIGIEKLASLNEQLTELTVPIVVDELKHKTRELIDSLRDSSSTSHQQMMKAAAGPHHPLHPWMVLHAGKPLPKQEFVAQRKQSHRKLLQSDKTYVVFSNGNLDDWFVTGYAFGANSGKSPIAEIQNDINHPIRKLHVHNEAQSGLLSERLQGAIRSKTFVIDKKYIHYLVTGKGSKIRLIIDGFQKIRNPIYGGLEFAVNHGDEPRWHVQDVSMWVGHRAYVEVLDDGQGYVGLHKIVFSDERATLPEPVNPLVLSILADESVDSAERLADRYKNLIAQTLSHWKNGKLNRAADVALINWMIQSPLIASIPTVRTNEQGKLQAKLGMLMQVYKQAEASIPNPQRAMAMEDGTPINEHVFIRGNHKNLGGEVPRRFLEVFEGNKPGPGTTNSSGRLELAKKIASPNNTLAARVLVNRIWKHHFGEGLVQSVDNFGVLGESPTHPQLLDWLATEFIQRGWSIKEMHRLMILSATYQMSSHQQQAAKTIDPTNKLLHRMPVKRLEGEIIRDAFLSISGRLDKKMFGPGIMPHLTPHMSGRGRPGRSGPLDGAGRRSIYINVRRNFLTPLFLVFDYPVPFTTIGRRSVSNVPAQALTMMNNPFILQQTKLWSQKVVAEKGLSDQQRIEQMFVSALARPPLANEMKQMTAFLQQQRQTIGEAQAWHELCHVIVNLKEFIYIH